ncbi:MAG: zinc-dependent alcohol dehydrogenase family protein [Candidatus Marinimicrobia bacterium]|nr:zinc-dependent alcohol dehydrogenase family protein [bacterium]MCG2716193.1 zinc-dependent alcohol dehydrogenase family protein [Candidatus Neomarinimicrobiota bacterium]
MQAALFDGKTLELTDYSLREPAADEVLIKVSACGICGTDIKILAGKSHASPPVILGHEFCGVVEECGNNVQTLVKSDFVSVDPNIFCGHCQYCRKGKVNLCENLIALGVDIDGGFAEYCLVPAKQCYKLPPLMNPIQAALMEPLSCVIYGFRCADIQPGDSVAIVGGGVIGIMMLKLARLSAARQIIIVEPDAKRRELCRAIGADAVFNPNGKNADVEIIKFTRGGAEVVIECVGSVAAVDQAYRLVKNGGKLIIFGVSSVDQKWTISPYDIFRKDITIRGSFLNPFTFKTAVELVASGKINFDDLDIRAFPLNVIQEAFKNQIQQKSLKTVIDLSL